MVTMTCGDVVRGGLLRGPCLIVWTSFVACCFVAPAAPGKGVRLMCENREKT